VLKLIDSWLMNHFSVTGQLKDWLTNDEAEIGAVHKSIVRHSLLIISKGKFNCPLPTKCEVVHQLTGGAASGSTFSSPDSPARIRWSDSMDGDALGEYKPADQLILLNANYDKLSSSASNTSMIETLMHEVGHLAAVSLLPHSRPELLMAFKTGANLSALAKFRRRVLGRKLKDHNNLISRPGQATEADLLDSERQLRFCEYLVRQSELQADAIAWFLLTSEPSLRSEFASDLGRASMIVHESFDFSPPTEVELASSLKIVCRILNQIFRPFGWTKPPWRRRIVDRG
jgi:hypothetical protein